MDWSLATPFEKKLGPAYHNSENNFPGPKKAFATFDYAWRFACKSPRDLVKWFPKAVRPLMADNYDLVVFDAEPTAISHNQVAYDPSTRTNVVRKSL